MLMNLLRLWSDYSQGRNRDTNRENRLVGTGWHGRRGWNKMRELHWHILPSCQGYGFSSSHVWTWELDNKESWEPKNWCFWTVVLEKILESPADCKEIQPVHPKGNQSLIFIWRTDAEAETPIFWPPDGKSWLIGKDSDAGRDWGAGGEGDDRGWDGWMASLTRWTWVRVNSGSWWWTGRPGVLRFMGSQRVGHNWATELNWLKTVYMPTPCWLKHLCSIRALVPMSFFLFLSLSQAISLESRGSLSLLSCPDF